MKSKIRLAPRANKRLARDLFFEDSFRSAPSGKLVLLPRVSMAELTECPSSSTRGKSNADWTVEPSSSPCLTTPRLKTTSCFLSPPLMKTSAVFMEQEMFLPEQAKQQDVDIAHAIFARWQ
eukprot:scaffold45027_cov244-Amphora_coffeaeformis.AAC.1